MDNSQYNTEIDAYLTDPQNYKSALELIENIDRIDRELSEKFWHEVTEKLVEKIKVYEEVNIISKYDQAVENCEWFHIQKHDWDFYFISTDREDVGINRKEKPQKDLTPYESLIKGIIEENKEKVGDFRNLKWPCWHTFSQYRFNDKHRKYKILPDLKSAIIDECVNTLFMYIDELIKVCNVINQKISEIQNAGDS